MGSAVLPMMAGAFGVELADEAVGSGWHDAGMEEATQTVTARLRRQEISDAVSNLGWRYLLGAVRTAVPVGSLTQATDVAGHVVAAAGPAADECLRADLRPDRVILTLQSLATARVTAREIELARTISAAVSELGLATDAEVGTGAPRSAQMLEIAIDALDIAAIRPFWKAVMGYDDEPGASGPQDAWPTRSDRARRSGSSRWMRRGHSATAFMSTSPCRMTRRSSESRRLWPLAARSPTPTRRPPSGYWPTPRATRHACAPGRAGTANGRPRRRAALRRASVHPGRGHSPALRHRAAGSQEGRRGGCRQGAAGWLARARPQRCGGPGGRLGAGGLRADPAIPLLEEIIGPRETRPLLCDWVRDAYAVLPACPGRPSCGTRP